MTLKCYSELILGVTHSKIPSVNSSIIYYKQACMDTVMYWTQKSASALAQYMPDIVKFP